MISVDFGEAYSVCCEPCLLKFKQPAGTSRGVYLDRKVWYVAIRGKSAGSHLFGIGECAPLPRLSCDDVPNYEELLRHYCRVLENEHAVNTEELRPYPSILFGLETAIRSAYGSLKGNPYLLYDTLFSRGECGITINGLVWMGRLEEMMARMEEKLKAGFRCIKIKIGAIDFESELQLIASLRERYDRSRVELRVDANGAFSPCEALEKLERLARYDIHSIEQPIRAGQWHAMAELCAKTPLPIALDEELIGVDALEQKMSLLDTIRPQYIILKPSLHGGLAGAEEWMRLSDERHIGYWVTSALESNVGLNAIAQWTSLQLQHRNDAPTSAQSPSAHVCAVQGLGTGQLYEKNYDGVHLEIEHDELWYGTPSERQFHREVECFRQEWNDASPCMMVHTSGSTGTPKEMCVRKKQMAASARMTIDFLKLKPGITALLCMPVRYIAGRMMVVRSILGNFKLISVVPSAHPLKNLWLQPDFIALTPMQAYETLKTPLERERLLKVPKILIGGGEISSELLSELQACEGEVWSSYGMTETLSHVAMRRLNGPAPDRGYKALPSVRLQQDGYGCLQIEAPALCDHRLQTNDVVNFLEDGSFVMIGRRDNVICTGGIKVQAEEVERKLNVLPVRLVVTSLPDEKFGRVVTLLYEGELSENEVETMAKPLLERYEMPRHIFKVSHLPLTETGKPARAKVQEMAVEMRKRI